MIKAKPKQPCSLRNIGIKGLIWLIKCYLGNLGVCRHDYRFMVSAPCNEMNKEVLGFWNYTNWDRTEAKPGLFI